MVVSTKINKDLNERWLTSVRVISTLMVDDGIYLAQLHKRQSVRPRKHFPKNFIKESLNGQPQHTHGLHETDLHGFNRSYHFTSLSRRTESAEHGAWNHHRGAHRG
jgi:hypothetical protein